MPEPTDMIVPLLQQMRSAMAARFDRVDGRFDQVDRGLAKLEATKASFKQALSADNLLSKLAMGECEERIEALERRVRELESQK
jgi:hypothetical protein